MMRRLELRVEEPNSFGSRPVFRRKHSNGSALPLTNAIFGMSAWLPSPSVWFRGRRVLATPTALFAHAVIEDSVVLRRHLPIWMTSGMFAPAGTLVRVNFPSGPVCAEAIALMLAAPWQLSHVGPVVNAGSAAVGSSGM